MSEQKSFPLTRLRLLSAVIRRGISPTYADFGTPVASQKCVRPHGKFNVSHARNHDTDTRAIYPENFVQPGDALINSTGTGTLGRSTVISSIDSPLTWDSHITLVRPRKDLLESRFLAYVLQNSENRFITLSQGSTNQIELSRDTVSNLPIPAIDLPTQRRIADYLDRETAQIDSMAGALDGLVARLEERRSAITELAFIDSTAIRAPLGALIERMEIGSAAVGDQVSASADEKGVLKTSAVSTGRFVATENRVVTSTTHPLKTNVRKGTLLVNRLNSPEYVGATCVPDRSYDNLFLSDKIWELSLSADPTYVSHWTKTHEYRRLVTEDTVGTSSSMLSLSYSRFCRFRIPLPPLDEQRRVADHLDAETAKIDAMIAKAGELRALLDERRSALITATVTGQHPVPEEP